MKKKISFVGLVIIVNQHDKVKEGEFPGVSFLDKEL